LVEFGDGLAHVAVFDHDGNGFQCVVGAAVFSPVCGGSDGGVGFDDDDFVSSRVEFFCDVHGLSRLADTAFDVSVH